MNSSLFSYFLFVIFNLILHKGLSIHIIINYILVLISSDLLNKTDIKWLNLSVAEVFSQVLLGVDDVFVAHTLVPCAPFMPRRASAGALSNVAGAYHWFLALLEAYCMLHPILRSTRHEKAQGTSVWATEMSSTPKSTCEKTSATLKFGHWISVLFNSSDDIETNI